MMKLIDFSLLFTGALAFGSVNAQTQVTEPTNCHLEETKVYLDTLKVRNCLQTEDGKTKLTESEKPIVLQAIQTITNLGAKKIILELGEDYFVGPALMIIGDVGVISRGLITPRLHDSSYVSPKMLSFPLESNQKISFLYRVSDVIKAPVEADRLYLVSMYCDLGYRFEHEPKLYGASLRRKEANQLQKSCLSSKFRDIRLK